MRSVNKKRLLIRRCQGEKQGFRSPYGKPHSLLMSGNIIWCGVCGSFTESRIGRLKSMCRGPPPQQMGSGGVRAQLQRLRAGKHPVTMQELPQTKWVDGTPVRSVSGYLRRDGREEVDEGFIKYTPVDLPDPKPRPCNEDVEAEHRRRLLHGRVRMKAGSKAREDRKRRKAKATEEAQWLIRVFQGNPEVEVSTSNGGSFPATSPPPPESANGECKEDSDEVFWHNLPGGEVRREWMQRIPSPPGINHHEMATKSRRRQPDGSRTTEHRLRCMELTCYEFGCNGEHAE